MEPDAFNRFEAAGWEQRAATYEDLLRPDHDARRRAAARRRRRRPRRRACSTSPRAPASCPPLAAERGASVVGVDIAEAMVAIARRLHPELEFRHGSAEALPFADGSFDAVVANFLMLHLGRPEQAAAEFARVLVPGGRLALTVWDVPEEARVPRRVPRRAWPRPARARRRTSRVGPPFFRFSDEQEFTRLLARAGARGRRDARRSPSRIARPRPTRCGGACSTARSGLPRSSSARRTRCSARSAPPSIGS